MKRVIIKQITTGLLMLVSSLLLASQTSLAAGDAAAGKSKSQLCAGCHGADGRGLAPNFPNLAGQVPGYIAEQLVAFKSGDRADSTMPAMVAALSEQDMHDLDAFYAAMPSTVNEISPEQEIEARKGEAIFRGGIKEFSVSACMACHGPDGKGIQPNFPLLSGQPAAYIEKQLADFKSGSRKDSMMNPIAFPLSDAQIKQLALYISALH